MTKACNKLNKWRNKYVHILCGPTHDRSGLWKRPSGIWSDDETWEIPRTHTKFLNKNTHRIWPCLRTKSQTNTNQGYFSKTVVCSQCHVSRASSLLSSVTKRETSSLAESRLMTHLVQRSSAAWERKLFSDSPFTHRPAETDTRGNCPRRDSSHQHIKMDTIYWITANKGTIFHLL